MSRFITFSALANPRRGNMLLGAGVLFALGLAAGALVNPIVAPRFKPLTRSMPFLQRAFVTPHSFAAHSLDSAPVNAMTPRAPDPGPVYPADVVRVIDGDTFVARVHVRQGLYVNTHVRLRDIDAAELHARCGSEFAKAIAARAALERILADGSVTISRIGRDKYPERIDASVATRRTADVSAAMLKGGYARAYDGGRRGSWCW
ncbi:MAG TPA: thermonuclease family protein [Xanthobacteraceae bacterium]|nr:thermonuclease family protein [Xanthobacteraceae bacterium]